MHKLNNLKEKLLKELMEYSERKSFTVNDIETIRNLISSVNKICEYTDAEEEKEDYSGRMSYNSYDPYDEMSHGNSYRGRLRAKRDSMGRYSRYDGYSRNDEFMSKLYEVMEDAPENKKHEIKKMIEKLEQM